MEQINNINPHPAEIRGKTRLVALSPQGERRALCASCLLLTSGERRVLCAACLLLSLRKGEYSAQHASLSLYTRVHTPSMPLSLYTRYTHPACLPMYTRVYTPSMPPYVHPGVYTPSMPPLYTLGYTPSMPPLYTLRYTLPVVHPEVITLRYTPPVVHLRYTSVYASLYARL